VVEHPDPARRHRPRDRTAARLERIAARRGTSRPARTLTTHFFVPVDDRPVPSVDLTVHLTDALDDGPCREWALVRIRTEHAGAGWAIDDSAVRVEDGRLLAVARQARRVVSGRR
jgi:hypothetical protein